MIVTSYRQFSRFLAVFINIHAAEMRLRSQQGVNQLFSLLLAQLMPNRLPDDALAIDDDRVRQDTQVIAVLLSQGNAVLLTHQDGIIDAHGVNEVDGILF